MFLSRPKGEIKEEELWDADGHLGEGGHLAEDGRLSGTNGETSDHEPCDLAAVVSSEDESEWEEESEWTNVAKNLSSIFTN